MVQKQAYSVREFAQAVGISTSTAWRLVWAERIRHVRVGRRVVIPVTAVQAFLSAKKGD